MKLKIQLLKLLILISITSICFLSSIFAWFSSVNTNTASSINGTVIKYTNDGLTISGDSEASSQRTYKLHEEINYNLKATNSFDSIVVDFNVTSVSKEEYIKLCKENAYLLDIDTPSTSSSYETEIEEKANEMYKFYSNNNILDFYTGKIVKSDTEISLNERTEINYRDFTVSGSENDTFNMVLNFGTNIYPSYTEDDETYTAKNYNCFLIGLKIEMTFIAKNSAQS